MISIKKLYEAFYLVAFLVYTIVIRIYSNVQPLILYPRVINFPITNKCNYRCVMCNVWKPEHSSMKDMTLAEIKEVFSQPLFKKVKHVGISGGEPFLRKDIFDIVITIVETLPKLRSISIITNASLPNTFEKTKEIKSYLSTNKIRFSLEVSIDGIGDIHDLNRGVNGAFDKTYMNFKKLNDECLVDTISTTITKNNIRTLYDNLNFARKHNVLINFRLASSIDRLFNKDKVNNFTLSKEEQLLLIKFLNNLVSSYENRIRKKLFYISLIGQLSGHKRTSGCDWRTSKGLSLDPYGNMYFCFPKSPKLYSVLGNKSNIHNLKQHAHLLKNIHENCDMCTHDYFGIPAISLVLEYIHKNNLAYILNRLNNSIILLKKSPHKKKGRNLPNKEINKVCIIGWYGTETLGDKAILGGIIDNLIQAGISLKNITIASLNVNYTRLTLHQMQLTDVKVIDSYKLKSSHKMIDSQDAFIFGGGPLCDIEPLVDMYTIFRKSKSYGKLNIIYSCGIGPLKLKRYIKTLNKILDISDIVFFRDRYTIDKYTKVVPALKQHRNKIFVDPAVAWIKNNYTNVNKIQKNEYIMVCIREWPYMYADRLGYDEYLTKKDLFEKGLAKQIMHCIDKSLKVILFPMNVDYAGDDDREYYRYFVEKFNLDGKVEVVNWDYTPIEALSYLKYAKFVIAMRFHSVVFSVTCKTPCIPIDYHYGNGKITGFMNEVRLNDLVINIDEMTSENFILSRDIFNLHMENLLSNSSDILDSTVIEMYTYFNNEIIKRA
ncbi:MAG: polysaccharide pyruvyl transferase family protein [Desulfobacula sp.]|nr:polysaccharide pyruvyl transferase family protein [Desulfobacula sp.]